MKYSILPPWLVIIMVVVVTGLVILVCSADDIVGDFHCGSCVQKIDVNNPAYSLVANKKLEDIFGQTFKTRICQSSFSDIEHIDLSIVLSIAKRKQRNEKETWMIHSLFAYLKNSYVKYGLAHIQINQETREIFVE